MSTSDPDASPALARRLERERAARREAEAIAERVTRDLYESKSQLEVVNGALNRTNEELQALNQAMREFVAIASHDLRSPLTSILGLASTLRRRWTDVPDENRLEFIGIIERQGHHLARMVEDLLTVSRIEAGALVTHAEVVAVREALDAIVKDFGREMPEIHVTCDEIEAIVDPDHLKRIVANYVGNAVKYGSPPVELEAHLAGDWVEIRVCDHGAGVPDELVPQLFGKFSRGEEGRAKGGTGLGLSIVQGLARANGGDSWYEPNPPHGSCFGVRLPRRAA